MNVIISMIHNTTTSPTNNDIVLRVLAELLVGLHGRRQLLGVLVGVVADEDLQVVQPLLHVGVVLGAHLAHLGRQRAVRAVPRGLVALELPVQHVHLLVRRRELGGMLVSGVLDD